MTARSFAERWPEFVEDLKAGRRSRPRTEEEESAAPPKRSYFLVDPRGNLHVEQGNLRDRFVAISEGKGAAGESGTEWTNLYPLAGYYFVRNAIPEDRRLNTVANALMWELTGPLELYHPTGEDGQVDAVPAQDERVKLKMRGPVIFHNPHEGIRDWQHAPVREAYERAVSKLRAKGRHLATRSGRAP